MLTERGWAAAGAGIALLVLWFLFGEVELGVAAILLIAAVLVAICFVGFSQPRLEVSRHAHPGAVHEGDHAAVTLRLRSGGKVLRHVTITDEVTGLGTAEFAVAAIPATEELTATYRVLCRPRGAYPIGPTVVTVTDPLGVARSTAVTGLVDSLIVYPAVENLHGFPTVRGRNLVMTSSRPEHSQRGGEDFYTLREFRQGDDLRRVHWPSSARRDELMIRQLETPWQARALVALDVRPATYSDGRAFERAVSGAASVVRHLAAGGFDADLWAGGNVIDARNYVSAMEALAMVTTDPTIDLTGAATRLRRPEGGGVLIVVGGEPDDAALALQRLLAATYPATVHMSVVPEGTVAEPWVAPGEVATVMVTADQPWAPAWARAMSNEWHYASASS